MASTTKLHGRRATAAAVLTGALVLSACSGGDDDASGATDVAAADFETGEATAELAEEPASTDAAVGVGDAGPPRVEGEGGFDLGVVGRDVIIEMRVVLSSDDIERTVASIMASASTLGGGVASSEVDYGNPGSDEHEGFAVLVVKVPPESVDRLVSGLDDTATIQSINQSAQDVTEQLVDLGVRIDNARESVANVREFMDRTENLNELVTLEAELTRRQTDLERLEAQQRNLSDRVALSTVTIEVIPTAAVPEPVADEQDSIGDAFRNGWGAFAGFLFAVGYVLAATLPFLASGLLLAFAAWLWLRRRADVSASPTGPAPADEPTPADDDLAAARPDREPEPTH